MLHIVKRTVITSGLIMQYFSLLARFKALPMHWPTVWTQWRKTETPYSRSLDCILIRDPILDLLTVSFKILNTQPYQKSLAVSTNYGPGTSLTFSRLMTYIYIYIHIYIYICRTAPLTSRCCILYIYSTNIYTEYFKHAAYSPVFPLQNAVYFIMLPFLVPILFTF